jgi:hypothetical protein
LADASLEKIDTAVPAISASLENFSIIVGPIGDCGAKYPANPLLWRFDQAGADRRCAFLRQSTDSSR